ncbi:MAG: hypothetical protein JO112_18830, partial [Planctomycetes bacterium]|nr:hypothetical protein [Planctomycetota bacterium]
AGFAQAVASVNDASGKLVVFAIGQADGALYRLDATPTKLSGTQVLQTLSAGVDGAGQADAFATGVDQSLFKFDSQNGFFQADGPGNALAVRAVGGNWAIVLTPDGSVFSYNGLGNGQGARFLIEGAGFGLGLDSVNLTSGDLVSDIVTTAHTVDQFDNGGLIALPGLTTL